MSSKSKLCLIVEATDGMTDRLVPVLSRVQVASVIVEPGARAALAHQLIETAQRYGAAGLISGDAELSRAVGADGVHVVARPDLDADDTCVEARKVVGRDQIVGVDAAGSRHAAMVAGEAGADYIAFGPIAPGAGAGERAELIGWWAETFEPPCVALEVETVEDACDLVSRGADFVAVRVRPGASIADETARMIEIADAVHRTGAEA